MSRVLGELDDLLDPGLAVTIHGRVYELPLPSSELGLWLQRTTQLAPRVQAASTPAEVAAVEAEVMRLPKPPGEEGRTFEQLMLGHAHAEMVAANVPHHYLRHCALTAYVWTIQDRAAAEEYYTGGPKSSSPTNRQERRAAGKTSTGKASATRTPASTSGTKSRPKPSSSTPRRRSAGTTS